jgi:SAM-dependent methyltransferase
VSTAVGGRRWSFGPLARLHDREVRAPRTARLAAALADLAGERADSVLDVGAGDGALGAAFAARLGAHRRAAVDPAPRGAAAQVADGARLPFPDASFEVVLLADVLHHARDAGAVLREAVRCASRVVVVKDHLARGWLDRARLYAMDVVGNPSLDVEIPGAYFTPSSFGALARSSGARAQRIAWPLRVHAPWLRPFAPSELQFAATLEPCRRKTRP